MRGRLRRACPAARQAHAAATHEVQRREFITAEPAFHAKLDAVHGLFRVSAFVADAVKPIPPSPGAQLEETLQRLDGKKQAWVDLPDAAKAQLLRRCIKCIAAVRIAHACTSIAWPRTGQKQPATLPCMLSALCKASKFLQPSTTHSLT